MRRKVLNPGSALPDKFLDPDIHEIHQVILGLCGLAQHGLEELLGRVIVWMDGQMPPDRRHMTPPRAGGIIGMNLLGDIIVPTCVAIWSTGWGTAWTGTKYPRR